MKLFSIVFAGSFLFTNFLVANEPSAIEPAEKTEANGYFKTQEYFFNDIKYQSDFNFRNVKDIFARSNARIFFDDQSLYFEALSISNADHYASLKLKIREKNLITEENQLDKFNRFFQGCGSEIGSVVDLDQLEMSKIEFNDNEWHSIQLKSNSSQELDFGIRYLKNFCKVYWTKIGESNVVLTGKAIEVYYPIAESYKTDLDKRVSEVFVVTPFDQSMQAILETVELVE